MSRQLSIAELDPILETLEKRFKETRPRPLQVVSSKLLVIATFGWVASYLIYMVDPEGFDLMPVALALFASQILFAVLSFRYLPVVERQRQFYRQLDLVAPEATPGGVFKARTAGQQTGVRIAVTAAVAALIIAILWNVDSFQPRELPPVLGVLGLVGATAYFTSIKRKIALATVESLLVWIKFGVLVWLAVLLFLRWQGLPQADWVGTLLVVVWPAWLLVKSRQVARIQDRFAPLARAGGLRESLVRQRKDATDSGSDSVALGTRDVAQLAYAEREMIRQDRVDAISRTRTDEVERAPVYVSDKVREQLSELEPRVRLAVQNVVTALSAIGAAEGADTGAEAQVPVEDTGWSLHYQVADEPRRVTVTGLTRSEPTADG